MELNRIVILAPAKINLHLMIGKVRVDGYHELISLFQKISFYDRLLLSVLKGYDELYFHCSVPSIQDNNIVLKAVRLFRERTGLKTGLRIDLLKKIPTGAGFGGASSDAASVLKALAELHGMKSNDVILFRIAAELGSDVPFFLGENAAIVTGRGEKVRSIVPRTDFSIVVVYPGFQILTKNAYVWLDERGNHDFPKTEVETEIIEGIINRYENLAIDKWGFSNSFEKNLFERFPVLKKIKMEMLELGAELSNITGSGSGLYGLFSDKKIGIKAFSYLKKNYKFVKLCKPLEGTNGSILKLIGKGRVLKGKKEVLHGDH